MLTHRLAPGLVLVVVLTLTSLAPGALMVIDTPPVASQGMWATQACLERDFGRLPLYFVENQGQVDERVAYTIQGNDKVIYFTSEGVTFALTAPLTQTTAIPEAQMASLRPMARRPADKAPIQRQRWTVKLDFVGASPDVRPVGQDKTGAVISYFKGRPDQWHAGLPTYARIVYADLWPGIDLVYYGTVDRLKYEFVVHPGADPAQIRLAYRGATNVALNAAGQLEVTTPLGGFSDDVPVAYQEIDGQRVAVDVAYDLTPPPDNPLPSPARREERAEEGVRFSLGSYDPAYPLILDPAVLVYCGYIGGSGTDEGYGIAVDGMGNAYIVGGMPSTEMAAFPVQVGPDLTYNAGAEGDAFVAKVKADGSGLVYFNYIGGSEYDTGNGIAVDSAGNAYITGNTASTDFPVTVGPDLTYNGGIGDAFVAKVNAAGSGLAYCGYIGGSNAEGGAGITVDSAGNAYVVGGTDSTDFPVTVGPNLTYNGGISDAFVAKVNAAGSGLAYCGYIGGLGWDTGAGVAVDGAGNAYVVGTTDSTETSFPVAVGPGPAYNGGISDAFVAKVNAAGSGLAYCGYIGGSGEDVGFAIAADSAGRAYVTGWAASTQDTFPVVVGPDLTHNGGYSDAFVAKVNAAGGGLAYCGYIGGSGEDGSYGIAVDSVGSAHVTGGTSSGEGTFPVAVGPDLTHNGDYDAFVAGVNAAGGGLVYCGYIGGSEYDSGSGIAVDSVGNAYITGNTASTAGTFPVQGGPDVTYNGGDSDAFVAKVRRGPAGPAVRVIDDNGDPVAGARVYRNGTFAGATGAGGDLEIPGLQVGDQLAATWQVTEVATAKGSHDQDSTQNWTYRVYLTSVPIDNQGNPGLHVVTDLNITQVLTVAQSNTLIGFNIVASVEWDAQATYLDEVRQGFQSASDYLYDATDGQMFFERVTIYDDRARWSDADYHIFANNQLRPYAWVYGTRGNAFFMNVSLGRYWSRSSANQGPWNQPDGFRTLIHEFGHYGLGLYDSYQYWSDLEEAEIPSDCTSPAIVTNNTPDINATLMDWQYNATELAMQGVTGMWSAQCKKTDQWQQNGESDWETVIGHYAGSRWQLMTPDDRKSVVAGPPGIPVTDWMTSAVNDANTTGICASDPEISIDWEGIPAADADVWLFKGGHNILTLIYQGKTDAAGRIRVLGAADGDHLVSWRDHTYSMTAISCPVTHDVLAADAPIEVILAEAPFTLGISVAPTGVDYRAQVQVKASTTLSGTPQAEVFQTGASTSIPVALAYESSTGLYTDTVNLDPSLAPAGSVAVTAQDTTSHTLQVFSNFGLFPVTVSEDSMVYSYDGQVKLYLPAGSLSADAWVGFAPDTIAGDPPEGLVTLSGPYSIQVSPGVTLNNGVGLMIGYLDLGGTLDGVDLPTARIYHWDTETEQWIPLDSNIFEDHHEVSAAMDTPGTYAVMAERPYLVYLPIVMRDY